MGFGQFDPAWEEALVNGILGLWDFTRLGAVRCSRAVDGIIQLLDWCLTTLLTSDVCEKEVVDPSCLHRSWVCLDARRATDDKYISLPAECSCFEFSLQLTDLNHPPKRTYAWTWLTHLHPGRANVFVNTLVSH